MTFNCNECGHKCEPSGMPCDLCNDTLCGACCDYINLIKESEATL